jgi:hypothetical protein
MPPVRKEANRHMPPIYKIGPDDEVDELELELEFQRSLTVEQRYKMMMDASRTILRMLIDNGHKKPFEIIKRT